jgi:DNA-binding NarL/FixJ family response regulator
MGSIQSFILKLIDNNIKYKSMSNLTITNPFNVLSKREKEVLDLMLQGAQVKDISASLELKSNTISTFKKNILAKTGVKNNIELFKLAQEHKIV